MKNILRLIAIATIPALLAAFWMLSPAAAEANEAITIPTTTTTASTTTTTTVAPTTTTIPTTTVPPETPDYDAVASADAFCADDGNVIVSVTFRGQALDDGGSLLILLDNVEMAELLYAPGEMMLENGEIRLNEPTTTGGTVTFVAHTNFGDFKFTTNWPAVPICPQTSSTSIVREQPPANSGYVSTTNPVTAKPLSFTG